MNKRRRVYCWSCGYNFPLEDGMYEALQALRNGYDFGDCICPNCWADESMLEGYEDD